MPSLSPAVPSDVTSAPSTNLPVQAQLRRQLRRSLVLIGLLPVGTLSVLLLLVENRFQVALLGLALAAGALALTRSLGRAVDRSTKEMRDLASSINHSAASIVCELAVLRLRIEEMAAKEAEPPNRWN